MKDGSKLFTPVGDGNMRKLDTVELTKHKRDISRRIFPDKEKG
jgi:hypothetical protein